MWAGPWILSSKRPLWGSTRALLDWLPRLQRGVLSTLCILSPQGCTPTPPRLRATLHGYLLTMSDLTTLTLSLFICETYLRPRCCNE